MSKKCPYGKEANTNLCEECISSGYTPCTDPNYPHGEPKKEGLEQMEDVI